MSNTKANLWTFPGVPASSPWLIDWSSMEEEFAWLRAMKDAPQDPHHHAEGDILTHTKLVCESLVALPAWQSLMPTDRSTIFAAALMHDIAKPQYTQISSEGRVSHHGHVLNGAKQAREILWQMGAPFVCREQVGALIRYAGLPLHLFEREDPRYHLIYTSQLVRCDWLALVAEADVSGRRSANNEQLLDAIALFRELAQEEQCLDRPRSFASPHSRVCYFTKQGGDPNYEAFDDTTFEVVLMSGLPAMGKDHWLQTNFSGKPVVSLDEIRKELKVSPEKNQGLVVATAKEKAREYLRRGQPFSWNATNTTKSMRSNLIGLFRDYKARVRIVYIEVSWAELLHQNAQRARAVPTSVINRLAYNLEIPDLTEAHQIEWHVPGI